jgi:exopolysaccharide biosynthesis polyprenyl glycosylphosphotransferase
MKNNASFLYSFCLVILDFLALLIAFVGAYIIRVKIDNRPVFEFVSARSFFAVFFVLAIFWVIILALLGLYNNAIYEKRFKEFGRLLVGSFVGLLFILSVAYVSKKTIFPTRLVPAYGFLIALCLLIIFRNIARFIRTRLFRYGIGINNLLIVGHSKSVEELLDLFGDLSSGYRVIGVAGYRGNVHKIRSFANFDEAIKHLQANNINSIIQAEFYASPSKNNQILEYAQQNHISYRFIPGNTELFVGNIDVELFRSSIPMIAVNQTALNGWGRIVKRLFDLAITIPLMIILIPVYLIITLLIFISDFGAPFFSQKRVTRYGRIFTIYKFRTIKKKFNGLSPEQAFESMGKPELIKQYRENGDQLPKDPRISSLGRFLRITSLDEIPQLWNVIKGDVSLVGPRALVPEEIKLATNKHHIVSVKSGLTGLAQVSGRKDISFEERRKLDVYYVQNWSFWFDLVIIAKTFRIVINGRGAK